VYEDLLAVPVIKGKKSEQEKFAGGLYTTTIEAYIPTNGRAIQAGTSHCLGQNFAKMFHIEFESLKGDKQLAWQNSWGLTTRTIGVMVMVHGDDKGLVLPPRIAPIQVVIVPIHFAKEDNSTIDNKASEILEMLREAGVRVHLDNRDNYNPGWKYNHWELKGVPIRLELGPKDVAAGHTVASRRDKSGAKETIKFEDLVSRIQAILADIQAGLFNCARANRDSNIAVVTKWEQFVPALDAKNLCLCAWCNTTGCEDDVKKRSAAESVKSKGEEEKGFRLTGAAKTLCTPFDQKDLPEGTKCFACDKAAAQWTLFGRSY